MGSSGGNGRTSVFGSVFFFRWPNEIGTLSATQSPATVHQMRIRARMPMPGASRQFMFMPHMPPWHMPPPHMPAPQSSMAGEALLDAAECAANVEYSVVRWSCPQDGQRTASASTLRLTSFSNLVPQSSQEYSKMGMLLN
jgi:hypothetical protein